MIRAAWRRAMPGAMPVTAKVCERHDHAHHGRSFRAACRETLCKQSGFKRFRPVPAHCRRRDPPPMYQTWPVIRAAPSVRALADADASRNLVNGNEFRLIGGQLKRVSILINLFRDFVERVAVAAVAHPGLPERREARHLLLE